MKIGNDKKTNLLDLMQASQIKHQKDPGIEKKKTEESLDKVELSVNKKEIEKIKERVQATPAVDQEKINAVKDAIRNETYNIRGELVAKSIIKNNLLDEIL
ncbi:MAG: Anti-sigma-28 factor, FlgM [Syntrophorhabdus sp. PtaU1.Bin058]|nr:MAG: Anti-sigma-28 factor, FlgM [Syntrophorhabdus sp. PtaU1.Bin058]